METNPPIRYTFAPKHYRSVAVETEYYNVDSADKYIEKLMLLQYKMLATLFVVFLHIQEVNSNNFFNVDSHSQVFPFQH